MKKMKLVVVVNGMAGIRTSEELLKLDNALYDITVFGSEPHPNYNRILPSPVLTGEHTLQDIILNDCDWYEEQGITLHTNSTVTQRTRARKECSTDDGKTASYDRPLLATGPQPYKRPVPGGNAKSKE